MVLEFSEIVRDFPASVLEPSFLIEVCGWVGTLILVLSYLVRTRMSLHVIALTSTCLKLYYTYEREVWPLFANWVILVLVHIYKIIEIRSENKRLPQ